MERNDDDFRETLAAPLSQLDTGVSLKDAVYLAAGTLIIALAALLAAALLQNRPAPTNTTISRYPLQIPASQTLEQLMERDPQALVRPSSNFSDYLR